MTTKELIALADLIKQEAKEGVPFSGRHIELLACFCAGNPRFNRHVWMAYIAGEVGPRGGRIGRRIVSL